MSDTSALYFYFWTKTNKIYSSYIFLYHIPFSMVDNVASHRCSAGYHVASTTVHGEAEEETISIILIDMQYPNYTHLQHIRIPSPPLPRNSRSICVRPEAVLRVRLRE